MEGGGFIVESVREEEQQAVPSGRHDPERPPPTNDHWHPPPSEELARSGCSQCSSLSFSDEFFNAFGVLLCNTCRRNEKLITKSAAKTQYQLTDGDLSKLGSVRRSNPQKKEWQPMRLYMESQVRDVAYAKHGGAEGIEARVRAVLDQKLQSRINKREEEREKDAKDAARMKRIRQKIEAGAEGDGAAVEEDQLSVEDI